MRKKIAGLAGIVAMAAGVMAGCQGAGKPAAGAAPVVPPAPEPADPSVSVLQLGVKAANYDEVMKLFQTGRDGYYGSNERMSGMDLVLNVGTEKYDLVSVDRAVVEFLKDPAGRDFSMGVTQTQARLFFPAETNISQDHKHGFIGLHFPRPLDGEIPRMTLRGTILAESGGKRQTLTFDNVPFATGSKFTVLGHDYTLGGIRNDETHPDEIYFNFTSDGSYDEVRAIRLLSVDGKKEVAKIWRVDRFMREPTSLLCSVQGERPQAMRIEVDTYEKPVELAIPFQLNLDLGAVSTGEAMKVVTTGTLPPAPGEEGIKAESQVVALTMDGPISGQDAKKWFGEGESVSVYRHAGVNMQVRVHVADRKMVRMASGPGNVLAFSDDTGANLLAKAVLSGTSDRGGRGEVSMISADGHDALVTVITEALPGAGAKELHFKGKIGVVMADSENVGEAKGVALVPGTTFKAGDTGMKVMSVRAAGAAGNGMYLTLMADKNVPGTVVLLDANRKKLGSAPLTQDRFGDRGQGSAAGFELAKALDTATVQVRTTNEGDAVAVPVEFTVPMGLGGEVGKKKK